MKKVCFILFMFLSVISCKKQEGDKTVNPDTHEFLQEFKHPPIGYQPAAFWSLNHKLARDEITIQLTDFKDKGFGGVFLHPRPGLITEYLSDEWYALCEHAVQIGDSLNMNIWLYDENSFPSGFAGGNVQEQMPESYNQGIALKPLHSDTLPSDPDQYPVILMQTKDKYVNVLNMDDIPQEGPFILYEKLQGTSSEFTGGYPYVDLLVEGVTEKFIEITMEGYEKRLSENFGSSVPGIFTDEPNIGRGKGDHSIRWSPDLFDEFKEQWGYNLQIHLPSLTEKTGDWKQIRHNYYQTLLDMFVERWAKPWHTYTEDNNLIWTGHYWEHGWPDPGHGGDNMAMYAWHQMPGIDMLFNTRQERPDQFGNNRAVKEVISVANQFSRNRILSETFGAAGWDLTFRDMLKNGNWQATLGVNFMTPHLSYYSITGTRKYDFPQSFSYHAPYWEHFGVLMNYFSRLSYSLSKGNQDNDVVVIEPTTSAWMYFSHNESQKFKEIDHIFERFVDTMEWHQYNYDLGCEDIIEFSGRVSGKHFSIQDQSYSYVILPPGTYNLNLKTVTLLKNFISNGGTVISFQEQIPRVNGAASDELIVLQNKHPENWKIVHSVSELNKLLPEQSSSLTENKIVEDLYHQERLIKDGKIWSFTNFGEKNVAEAQFFTKFKHLYELDAFTGKIYHYPVFGEKEKFFSISLHPSEGLILLGSNTALNADKKPMRGVNEIKLNDMELTGIRRGKENVLMLDYCNLKTKGLILKDVNYYEATMELFSHYGFKDGNPWTVAVQLKDELIRRDTFDTQTAFTLEYPFYVDLNTPVEKMREFKVAIESAHLYDVYINGKKAEITGDWWVDRNISHLDIGHSVVHGKNVITLEAPKMSVYAELEPVFITGDFHVNDKNQNWTITETKPLELGSWINQGLPFYKDWVNYEYTLNTTDPEGKYKLGLSKWSGSVCEIIVNGVSAGLIMGEPFTEDISRNLIDGENKIQIKVYGTLRNVWGPFHQDATPGIVTPWSWKFPPENQPAPEKYKLYDYGLWTNPEIVNYRQ